MDREQAREFIRGKLEEYLSFKGIKITARPFRCLNPMHEDNNPSMSFDRKRNKVHCFACGADYDTFDLIAIDENLKDYREIFRRAHEIFKVDVDDSGRGYQKKGKSEQYEDNHMSIDPYIQQHTEKNRQDFTSYFRKCQAGISKTDYPQNRGLSPDTVRRFGLGYDANFSRGTGGAIWKALIIPTGPGSYTARNTAKDAEKENRVRKAGGSPIYNTEVLKDAREPVFVVEGEIDALSIIEAGGVAVALGSTANVQRFLKLIEQQKPEQQLIIALDSDNEGEKAARKLAVALGTLKIPFYRHIWEGHKDANEALMADRDAFIEQVRIARSIGQEDQKAEREAYLATSAVNHLQSFIDGIANSVNTPFIPTGFKRLDEVLDGGLFEGLYVLGAISSNGKTTFALQLVDQIARAGNDVLIFSLEMSRFELMAKSISRETFLEALDVSNDAGNAKTVRGITTGSRYAKYSRKEKEIIEVAIKAYGEYAGHIYISEGMGDVGTVQIREQVRKHFSFTGKKPVVVIDYLQILAPNDARATDKQNMDKATMELKRISRDYKIPVLGISSFNRANYKEAVTMEAFKESGAIEYSSDVLIGLQLKGAGDKRFNVDEAKNKNPRDIELVVLKNRNGATGKRVDFEYYQLFNYFFEVVDGSYEY
jgi:replicative DNA helicase